MCPKCSLPWPPHRPPVSLKPFLLCSQDLGACYVPPCLDGSSHDCHLLPPHFILPLAQKVLPQEQLPGDCLSKSRFMSLSETLLYSQISSVLRCAHYYLTEAIHSSLQFSRKYSTQRRRLWRLDAQSLQDLEGAWFAAGAQ